MRVAKAKHPTGPFIKRNYPVLETDWALYGSVRYSGRDEDFPGEGISGVLGKYFDFQG